jgi:hypothetical protein
MRAWRALRVLFTIAAATACRRDERDALPLGSVHALSNGHTCTVVADTGMPATNQELGVPGTTPDAHGLIDRVTRAASDSAERMMWIISPGESPDQRGERSILVPATTRVMQRVGHRASPGFLAPCQVVSIWMDSAARESRGSAAFTAAVVIEQILEHQPRR